MGEQITIFDLLEEESDFLCDQCVYNCKGCCGYNEPLGRTCVEGDAFEDILYVKVDDLVRKYDMGIKDMLVLIEKETGFKFVWSDKHNGHYMKTHSRSRDCTVEIGIDLDRYEMTDCTDWFLGFDFQFKASDHYGGAYGCDSLIEVIHDIRRLE